MPNAASLEAAACFGGRTMSGQISFVPTVSDHVAAQRLWMASYLRRRPVKVMFALFFIILLLGIALVIVETTGGQSLLDSIGAAAPLILVPVVFIGLQVLGWAQIPGSLRRMSQQQPSLLSETTWRWDDTGLSASSAAGTSFVRWPELYRWLSGSASIVLMLNQRMVLVMPRRFLSDEQARDLEETLRAFSGPSK
jgi:hypothetical protein